MRARERAKKSESEREKCIFWRTDLRAYDWRPFQINRKTKVFRLKIFGWKKNEAENSWWLGGWGYEMRIAQKTVQNHKYSDRWEYSLPQPSVYISLKVASDSENLRKRKNLPPKWRWIAAEEINFSFGQRNGSQKPVYIQGVPHK